MQNIKQCIVEKFANVGGMEVGSLSEKDPKYWTALLNRKSLLFVNDNALPFFIDLCKLLQLVERVDGSVPHAAVMEKVVETNHLTMKWDSIVENSLSEFESFRFMSKVIRSVANTYGKGVMLRRMNARARTSNANKATLAISHRAGVIAKIK